MKPFEEKLSFREANSADVPEMMRIRFEVKENVLSNPNLVTAADCEDYINRRGKGWVCATGDKLVGFAIADLADHNIWALFIEPGFEGAGIGRRLHQLMLDWYFEQTDHPVWLSTDAGTRAEAFYRRAGWKETGAYGKTEIKFEMSRQDWKEQKSNSSPLQ